MSENLSLEGLSDDIVKYIKDLRGEAARYRTERNEVQAKYDDAGGLLKQANTKLDALSAIEDQLESTVKERTELSTNYDKLRAAAKFGIPEEVDRLKGSSYDEWEKDAEGLAEKIGPRKTSTPKDPAAGDQPKPTKRDPILEAFRAGGYA